jgi:hypothetical protein
MLRRHLLSGSCALALGVVFASAIQSIAGGLGLCAHCGCNGSCQKVCRLVCEDKKVEVIHFGCQCEHFCIGGPSKPGCQHCECLPGSCDENCDCKSPFAAPKKFLWTEWIPGCANVFTKKKLMRKTETVTVKSYKWVVEDVCANCDAKSAGADITPGVDIPAPPIAGVPLKFGRIEQPLHLP